MSTGHSLAEASVVQYPVTGAFRIIAKTIASRNNNIIVITVRAKRNKIPIPIANANALIRAEVRFMLLIFSITHSQIKSSLLSFKKTQPMVDGLG